ncbi:hypothetical protein B0H17DRAFT_1027435 [Mycena rosella]|uniref:Uncharacterized protein n=1 Tax=Mycena rosella TaxID=1033263 RepID=A0AAD7MCM1_MYCRO|nr:hypothetical protein B0H17DRAFT_1027435 [Mycena rosella]
MWFFNLRLLCSLALVARSTTTLALNITVPSLVGTPTPPMAIYTVSQPGDPTGDRFYSVSNSLNSTLPRYNLTPTFKDNSTVDLAFPFLPDGDGWVLKASLSFNSSNFIGTSNTFTVENVPPETPGEGSGWVLLIRADINLNSSYIMQFQPFRPAFPAFPDVKRDF